MRQIFSRKKAESFGEIYMPPRNPRAALGSLLEDGGESYLATQDCTFALRNRIQSALQISASAAARIAKLRREERAVEQLLDSIPATIPIARKNHERTRGAVLTAVGLCGVGALGAGVSAFVLTDYVLSSASSLFVGNTFGAALFSTLPTQAAIAIKLYEQRLISPVVRWRYTTALFGLGIASLAVWMIAAAFHFKPQTGGLTAQLLTDGGDYGAGFALLLSTVLCDLSFGYMALSGAALAGTKSDGASSVANPEYRALFREKVFIERAIAEGERQQIDAEDYLSRAKAGRERARSEAQAELARLRTLWTQRQTAARSMTINQLLNDSENEP